MSRIYGKILPEAEALELVKEALYSNSPVAWDTESNGKDIRDGRGIGFGISIAFNSTLGPCSFYMPFRHTSTGAGTNYNLNIFLPWLQKVLDNHLAIQHNSKYDLVCLRTFGFETKNCRFIDTMLVAHLVNENQPQSKSLDSCAKHYLNDSKRKDALSGVIKVFGWEMLTPDLIAEYASYDAYLALKLYEALVPLAKAEDLNATWAHKAEFTQCLIDMELAGIRIDTELCEKMTALGEVEMQSIRDELGLNPGSPKELKELLIDRLGLDYVYHPKTGNPTFDKNAMAVYEAILERSGDETARHILTYRGWQKSVSSNYQPYISLISPDGRLRPNYKMHGTKTGRLSCENPNLQQIPKAGVKPWNGEMKKCFVPATGFALWGFDYSQLELRVGTAYAGEPELAETFRQGKDVFDQMTAEFQKGLGNDWSRNNTKTLVYSIQYGAGINRISNVFGVGRARAEEIRQNYYNTYPRFRDITREASNLALRDRKIKLWSGRYRHFLYPSEESFKAFNSVIQGGSADIVERAMLRIWKMRLPPDECRMLLQVHDELIFEIRTELVEKYKPIIMDAMTRIDWHPMFERVKFAAEGKPWGAK